MVKTGVVHASSGDDDHDSGGHGLVHIISG